MVCECVLFQNLLQRFITPCIDYITEGLDDSRKQTPLNTVIHQTSLNMLTQFCHVFDAMFPPSLSFPTTSQSLSTTAAITTTTAAAVDAAAVDSVAAATITAANEDDIIECGFIEVKIGIFSFEQVEIEFDGN